MTTTKADWSMEYCPRLDNGRPGQEYPDTPGQGRRFPDRSEEVNVQKRIFLMFFFCISVHSEHFLFLGEKS